MAAIEPAGLHSGDEELRAVAMGTRVSRCSSSDMKLADLRVGAGVGHGEKTRAGVLDLEVLIGELLAVDGLATRALLQSVTA